VRLGPGDPVAEDGLLPAGQDRLSLLLRQIEQVCEQVGQFAHCPLLSIGQGLDQRQHHGLEVGDGHRVTSP
jgi:hypothetical protein